MCIKRPTARAIIGITAVQVYTRAIRFRIPINESITIAHRDIIVHYIDFAILYCYRFSIRRSAIAIVISSRDACCLQIECNIAVVVYVGRKNGRVVSILEAIVFAVMIPSVDAIHSRNADIIKCNSVSGSILRIIVSYIREIVCCYGSLVVIDGRLVIDGY